MNNMDHNIAVLENYLSSLDAELDNVAMESAGEMPEFPLSAAYEAAIKGDGSALKRKLAEAKNIKANGDPQQVLKIVAICLGVAVATLAIVYAVQKKTGKTTWTTAMITQGKNLIEKAREMKKKAKDAKYQKARLNAPTNELIRETERYQALIAKGAGVTGSGQVVVKNAQGAQKLVNAGGGKAMDAPLDTDYLDADDWVGNKRGNESFDEINAKIDSLAMEMANLANAINSNTDNLYLID